MYTFSEPSDIKLIILYIIENYGEPIDNGQITDVFMEYAFVDYFTMQKYLDELCETKLVDIDLKEGRLRQYILTKHGKEAYEAYIRKIPVSVREKLLGEIKAYKKKERRADDVVVSFRPQNELSYEAALSIREAGFPLLDIRLSLGDKETAREACRRFRENPQETYDAILRILTGTRAEEKSKKSE